MQDNICAFFASYKIDISFHESGTRGGHSYMHHINGCDWSHSVVMGFGHRVTEGFLVWSRGQIEESENAGSRLESNPGHLARAVSALPLSYDNWTTTSPHNPLYILHRWD